MFILLHRKTREVQIRFSTIVIQILNLIVHVFGILAYLAYLGRSFGIIGA